MISRRIVWAAKPTSLAFVATLLCTVLWLDAKPTFAQDTTQVMSATLLKRLAEAVDGQLAGDTVYVVASREFPNTVLGTFTLRLEAYQAQQEAGWPFDVFGPFEGKWIPELGGGVLPGCVHDRRTSVYRWALCPDRPLIPFEDVRSMSMIIELMNGERIVTELPLGTDAIFLTLPAIDKFVVPYYSRILGPSEVAQRLEGIKDRIGSR